MKYEQFITHLSRKCENMSHLLVKKGLDFNSYHFTFPPSLYNSLWMPLLEKYGFYSALPHITAALHRFLICLNSTNSNEAALRQRDYIISVIYPQVMTYKSQNCSTLEIINRAREMRKSWKVGPSICSALIFFLQSSEEKENDPESKKLKIISDLLLIFDTNQSKLDYKQCAMQLLHQSVGEIVFTIKICEQSYEDIYRKLCTSNREKIIYLLSKIKKKEGTYAALLQQIVNTENNKTDLSKIINICAFFLLTQNWDRFKETESKLKDPIVVQIVGEAFERLFYLAYNEDHAIGLLLLNFISLSKFTLYDEMKQGVAYHLLALYKFYIYSQKSSAAKLVERIWADKMKGVKLAEIYCEHSPNFVSKSQWGEEKLEEAETRSINSRSSHSEVLTLRSNRASKSRQARSTRGSSLQKRLKCIEEELRKCSFQKVYLLIQSLKKFYLEYEDRRIDEAARNAVISLLVLLSKKMETKIDFRYGCCLLRKAIYLQMMELQEKCFSEFNFQYNEKNVSLGLFECCYIDRGEINLQALIKFHEKNNYEDSLQTVFSLKSLSDDLNSNSLSGVRLQNYEELLAAPSLQFQSKVYSLYKGELNESKKMDVKRLAIICKLLLLKSNNVTNNLLVNYVFLMLKQGAEGTHKKKLDAYSKLMNAQLALPHNQERAKIFLIMGEIFEEFSEQSFRLMDTSIGNRYFQLLRRKEHAPFYYTYSQAYLAINYLKEALYFLELHNFTEKAPSSHMLTTAIYIYQRLNNPFKTHLSTILDQLNINQADLLRQTDKEKERFPFELFVQKMRNQMENEALPNQYEEYYVRGSPKIQLWLNYYFRYLQFFIEELASHKESEQIGERLRRYAIIVKYIHLKIDVSRQALTVTYNDLKTIIDLIQRLRSDDDRRHFYLYFLEMLEGSNQVSTMEDIYLQNLLACGKHSQLLAYLRRNLKPNEANAQMKSPYLCHLIKMHFQRCEFDRCLSMITLLAERKEKLANPAEIYHIELECKYKLMLNYTLEEYLGLINKCVASSANPPPHARPSHFQYYFRIFRMLFNRYHFASLAHNDLFLQTYFNFIDANALLADNIQYISQTILYLLRFAAQKFDYSAPSPKCIGKTILERFQGKTIHFVPFCNYLIKRISFNANKNQMIKAILKTVLTQHPSDCLWTISFLKNFNFRAQKASRLSSEEANEVERLAELFKEVLEVLQTKKTLGVEQLNWIDSLVMLSLSETDSKRQKCGGFKQAGVPGGLIFMFNRDYFINRIEEVRVLSNGKSAPLQLMLNLVHGREKHYLTVKVIVKGNIGVKKYRMESNTANFFEEIGLIDSDITYKIIHLSKCLVAIQHRPNCGTVNAIINEALPDFKKIEALILLQLQKRRGEKPNEKRMLAIFDNNNRFENRVRFSQVIYFRAKNVKDWWRKYSNFVRTHAQWSYLGYVVGLGDRHCDNILFTEQAKLIHIDFQYALDTGLKLPFPEWVPFRLTSCFVEPLGVLGVWGMYFAEMVATARQFEEQDDCIWKALSHFVGSMDTNVCEEILQRSKFSHLNVSSTETGVAKLISSAKDPELLRLMFQGWRSYL